MTDKLLELLQEIGDKGHQIAIRINPHRRGSFALLNYDDGVLCETDDPIGVLRKWSDDTADVAISYSLAPEETASDIIVGIQGAIIELQHRLSTLAAETRRLESKEDPFRKRTLRRSGTEEAEDA